MPEEINRLVTDAISDVLWTPSPDGDENLRAEGVAGERITRVGNIMLDSFELVRPAIEAADVAGELGLSHGGYGLVTLHRPSNVDEPDQLERLVSALLAVQSRLPLVFPVHPRTAQRLAASGLDKRLEQAGVRLTEPQPYIRFMSLVTGAAAAITDSGGIQEETTYLGIPCLTLREKHGAADHDQRGHEPSRPPGHARARTGCGAVGSEKRTAAARSVGRAHRGTLRGRFARAQAPPGSSPARLSLYSSLRA
jgi:UDP-N-acetylglucosamine 2-epimerase